jgi:hypothetical protein
VFERSVGKWRSRIVLERPAGIADDKMIDEGIKGPDSKVEKTRFPIVHHGVVYRKVPGNERMDTLTKIQPSKPWNERKRKIKDENGKQANVDAKHNEDPGGQMTLDAGWGNLPHFIPSHYQVTFCTLTVEVNPS